MTPEQIKARLETLEKYEWVFNQYLRSSECRMGTWGEVCDLAENHREIFGSYPNIQCGACKAEMMKNLATWYFDNKSKYVNA